MSFVCYRSRVARKRYRCYLCGQHIDIGDRHEYSTGVNEGDFWSMRLHVECSEAVNSDRNFEWECFEEHSLERPMTAFCPEI